MSGFSVLPDPNKFRLEAGEVLSTRGYGLLYNWYAAVDVKNITAVDWHVPTNAEFLSLSIYLGGHAVSGGKLKEVGFTYWASPNTGATNEVGFNGRGVGQRGPLGVWRFESYVERFITTTLSSPTAFWVPSLINSQAALQVNTVATFALNPGYSIRPIKDSTILAHGETGVYVDPSGYIYPTICIGTQEWVACNIRTQHYRNGDPIPEVTDNAAWAALTTGAMCAYNNDWNNV
jgi:uncharacterized protein (TIGR02145 family)